MYHRMMISLLSLIALTVNAETINLTGKVTNSTGQPIANAILTLVNQGLKDTTTADGTYLITNGTPVVSPIALLPQSRNIVLENGSLEFSLLNPAPVKIEIFTIEGKLLKREMIQNASRGFYRFNIDKNFHSNLLVIRTSIGQEENTFRYVPSKGKCLVNQSNESSTSVSGKLAKITAVDDSLKVTATGFKTKTVSITSYDQQLNITLDSSNGSPSKTIVLSEGFEGTNLDDAGYMKLYNPPAYGWLSITTNAAHTGTYSLVSDSNNTGLRKWLDDPIVDSIAGLEFYLMAKKSGKINFYAAITTMGTSAGMLNNGFFSVLGMGVDKSDSLWCTFQKWDNPQADSDLVNKNFAALEFNKWYKCNIEYDFAAQKVTYSLDNVVKYTRSAPGIKELDMLILSRDNLGEQGPKDYFIDDISVYKR